MTKRLRNGDPIVKWDCSWITPSWIQKQLDYFEEESCIHIKMPIFLPFSWDFSKVKPHYYDPRDDIFPRWVPRVIWGVYFIPDPHLD